MIEIGKKKKLMNKRVRCPVCHKTKDGLGRKYWKRDSNQDYQYVRVQIKTHKVGLKRCKGSQRIRTILIRSVSNE